MGIVDPFVLNLHLLKKLLGNKVVFHLTKDELVVKLNSFQPWVFFFLKYHSEFQFDQLMDIYGLDYPERPERFELQYVFWSSIYRERLRLILPVRRDEIVLSLSSLYSSANWLEREVWDMFGIYFENHDDLRRILTDYGFEGFPLRKDFPVTGFLEVRYSEPEKRIVYEPVELAQEYRLFHFLSPWEKK